MKKQLNQDIDQWSVENSEANGKPNDSLEAKYAHIPGWGIDANAENDPTYPMKEWNGDDYKRLNYQRPLQQEVDVYKLHSNERPGISSVFGHTIPPNRVSGELRRFAFRYSEGNWTHWLTLILADRIHALEGIVNDVRKGHVPNIFAERGWNAEWRYNRKGVLKTAAIGLTIAAALLLLKGRSKSKRKLR